MNASTSFTITAVAPPPPINNPTLVITGPSQIEIGQPVTIQATASGGTAPYTYSAANLPPGLSINPTTGAITGTLTTAGAFTLTVSV